MNTTLQKLTFCCLLLGAVFSAKAQNFSASAIATPSSFCGGTGLADDPYLICTPEQLNEVRSNLSAHYKLANDIDLADYLSTSGAGYNSGAGWQPIGNSSAKFTGSLSGAGHIIKNLYINRPTTNDIGLFGFTELGVIIDSIGVVGANITGYDITGGVVGENHGTIEKCYTTGAIGGNSNVGGLAGASDGTITNCYNTATVTNTGNTVGGVTGWNDNTVTYCYNSGAVSGPGWIGGVIGWNTGSVSLVKDCFFLQEKNGINDGLTGLGQGAWSNTDANPETDAQMKMQTTFTNWDFSSVWMMQEGVTYPLFQWQSQQYGLIFDVSTGKFYLNIDGTGNINATSIEYTGRPANRYFSGDTLYLNNFTWTTPAAIALTIANGNVNIDITGDNQFISTYNGTIATKGIFTNDSIVVSGGGTLTGAGGTTTNGSYGIHGGFTLNGGTVNAIGGKGIVSYGLGVNSSSFVTINDGLLNASGGTATGGASYGIYVNNKLIINGGTIMVTTTGANGVALFVTGPFLPTAYTYWTNTVDNSDPGGIGTTYPGTAFENSYSYLFVKIVTEPGDPTVVVEEKTSPVNIYPNPAKDILNIQTELNIKQISVLDMQGKLLKTWEGNDKTIDLQSIPAGNYIIKIQMDNSVVEKKFMKK